MRHYELVVVLSPMLNQDQATETWERIKGFISTREAEITHEEKWGTRRLAYPIRKGPYHFQEGTYNLARFSTETPFNKDLETFLRLDEQVLRSMVIATDTPKPVVEPTRPPPPAVVAGPVSEAEAVAEEPASASGEAAPPVETETEETVAVLEAPDAAIEEETPVTEAEETVAEAEVEEPPAAEEETSAAETGTEEPVTDLEAEEQSAAEEEAPVLETESEVEAEEPTSVVEPSEADGPESSEDQETGTPNDT